jgi:hypothetical protein
MIAMALAAKELDVKIGHRVGIEGRMYDVVPGRQRGVALEPAITKTVAEMLAQKGQTPLSTEEFEEQFGDLPSDSES